MFVITAALLVACGGGSAQSNGTFARIFATSDTQADDCRIHGTGMSGRVVVK